jgi:hypothetical protein
VANTPQVSGGDIDTTGTVNGFFAVQGNLFEGVPAEFHNCAPILGGYVVGTNISNNAVLNASNGGICVGWGWSRDEARNAADNSIVGNYVKYCKRSYKYFKCKYSSRNLSCSFFRFRCSCSY